MGAISVHCLVDFGNALLQFEYVKYLQLSPKIDRSMSLFHCRQNTVVGVDIVIPGLVEDLSYLALKKKGHMFVAGQPIW